MSLFVEGQTYWWFHVESGKGGMSNFNPQPENQERNRPLKENIRLWNMKVRNNAPHHWAYGSTREEAISVMREYRDMLGLPVDAPMQYYP